jgi:hypothetical protein
LSWLSFPGVVDASGVTFFLAAVDFIFYLKLSRDRQRRVVSHEWQRSIVLHPVHMALVYARDYNDLMGGVNEDPGDPHADLCAGMETSGKASV